MKDQSNPWRKFTRATINASEELAGLLGPADVTFYSQDDKVKMPIWLVAASKQVLLLVYMEYKVTLQDHDYVRAQAYPVCYRWYVHTRKGFLWRCCNLFFWSYVPAIRSPKHSGSSVYYHLQDMKLIRSLDIFDDSFNSDTGELKLVMS